MQQHIQDGTEAVRLAELAAKLTRWRHFSTLDTLAAGIRCDRPIRPGRCKS